MRPSTKVLLPAAICFLLVVSLVSILRDNPVVPKAFAQASPVATIDPCSTTSQKSSSAITAITTATTTGIVNLVAGQIVFVCGYMITSTNTVAANTIQWETGTGATCGGGTVVLSGVMNLGIPVGATVLNAGSGMTLFASGVGKGICIVSTVGTTPSIAGYITFVQQ